jgi:hypothetical protein
MWLTKKRLENIKSYLFSKNISKNQISGMAYDEDKVTINCSSDIACNEADHKQNRRVNYNLFRDTIHNSSNSKN